jgi:hypothetical protein
MAYAVRVRGTVGSPADAAAAAPADQQKWLLVDCIGASITMRRYSCGPCRSASVSRLHSHQSKPILIDTILVDMILVDTILIDTILIDTILIDTILVDIIETDPRRHDLHRHDPRRHDPHRHDSHRHNPVFPA